ncbi:MAG: hypothetical protein DI585_05790 [Pseudomonas fluorescens]|nr:MAG: hypothetical protein DI585_05790 [Pseudomonas fluorescens]
MARTFAWLLAMLMFAAAPSWAQQTNAELIELDPKTKCWAETSNKYLYAINIEKPNTYVFLVMRGAPTKADEAVASKWANRTPAFWLNSGKVPRADRIVEFTEYAGNTAYAKILTPGQYILMVADESQRGLLGYSRLCLRPTDKL